MKCRPLLTGTAAFIALSLYSCGPETSKKSALASYYNVDYLQSEEDVLNNDIEMNELFDETNNIEGEGFVGSKPVSGTGRKVPRKYVQWCLDEYVKVMHNHGFDDPASTTNISSPGALMTLWERFRGKEMMKFLRKAAHLRHKLNGKAHLAVHVELGAYTKKYLDSIAVAGETPDYSKIGRVAVFLVTRVWPVNGSDTTEYKKFIAAVADDPDSYDFGGLKP